MEISRVEALRLALASWKPHPTLTPQQVSKEYIDIAKEYELYLKPVDLVKTQDNPTPVGSRKK